MVITWYTMVRNQTPLIQLTFTTVRRWELGAIRFSVNIPFTIMFWDGDWYDTIAASSLPKTSCYFTTSFTKNIIIKYFKCPCAFFNGQQLWELCLMAQNYKANADHYKLKITEGVILLSSCQANCSMSVSWLCDKDT